MKISTHVIISGRVQGVWFRASTRKKAQEIGLTGWVKNTEDGKVEAVFEGEEDKVEKMISWCHLGPPFAKVEEVVVKKQEKIVGFEDFLIRY